MSTLPEMYRQRAALNVSKWQASQDMELRKLEITPAEGWPGKNEETRGIARDKAFAADEAIRNLSATIGEFEHRLGILAGDIEAAEAERRAEEWRIRARLCAALEARAIQQNGRGDRAEAGFDDAAQAELDCVYDEDSIPF